MSFATAGMTRSAVSTYAPPMGRTFQNLGEQAETRANSLATLQQLAEARIDARQSSVGALSAMSGATSGNSMSLPTRRHWSNSGLVDLHSTRAHFDAPMKPQFATGERTVYVAATNSKSKENRQQDAKKIVQSYVNSLAPEEAPRHALRNVPSKAAPVKAAAAPVKAAAAPVARHETSSAETKAETKALKKQLDLMSDALTKLSEQQIDSAQTLKATAQTLKATQAENQTLKKVYNTLEASHSTLKKGSDDLMKTNAQLKKEIDNLKKDTQTSLGFARMAKKNRE